VFSTVRGGGRCAGAAITVRVLDDSVVMACGSVATGRGGVRFGVGGRLLFGGGEGGSGVYSVS